MPASVLERERFGTQRNARPYERFAGRGEEQEISEEKALHGGGISDSYQRLINPEYGKEEEYVPEPQTPQEILFGPRGTAQAAPRQASAPAFEPSFARQHASPDLSTRLSVRSPAFETQAPAEDFIAPAFDGFAPAAAPAEEAEDLMPTATTIQYKSGLFEGEKPATVAEKKGVSITAKGKLLMAIYALVVVVILALIIVNTSVLRTLDSDVAEQEARLTQVMSRHAEVEAHIAEITSDEYIIDWAEANGFVRAA